MRVGATTNGVYTLQKLYGFDWSTSLCPSQSVFDVLAVRIDERSRIVSSVLHSPWLMSSSFPPQFSVQWILCVEDVKEV